MDRLTRRDFLKYGSAAALCSVNLASGLKMNAAASPTGSQEEDQWIPYGRLGRQQRADSLVLEDGFLISKHSWADTDFSFQARSPEGVEVQIWAGLRCRDRDSRYVFGLRGGNNDHLYLARYAPDGGDRFLGIAPLGFHPQPAIWYALRAAMRGNRIHIYVNGESLPRINVEDAEPLWNEGGVSLGGGWLPAEFREVDAGALAGKHAAMFNEAGSRVHQAVQEDKGEKRRKQRAAYKPLALPFGNAPRSEYVLDGDWLFCPAQELSPEMSPQAENIDDTSWHVMEVPHFWTPTATWLHAEMGFPNLEGLSRTKGISDRFYESELERLDSYTFDWKATRSGWYRHYIDLPAELSGRVVELSFGAIAKVADVWVNGQHVSSHVGMFGEVQCAVTHAVRPGRNLLAVLARSGSGKQTPTHDIAGVAVTVEVTEAMLHSLPHGMYPEEAAGIWQPVTLTVTQPVAVKDVFIQPRLDGLSFELELRNAAEQPRAISVDYVIRDARDGSAFYTAPRSESQSLGPEGARRHYSTPSLNPKLWSPHEPNLYHLEVRVYAESELVDRHITRFGFRTFAVAGNRFLLNGNPFWLRGANHFPHALRPNDSELARKFMELAREGNVLVTRSHTAPFTDTWLHAADEVGMAVSYEGTWPWLMLEGDLPQPALLDAWKTEFASLLRRHRNHPSIVMWTVNNEMKFEFMDRKQPELLRKKWDVLSGMVKTMRAIDSTRPVVCDSSYYRKQITQEYEDLIRPNGLDDGDIDDAHRYFGWYDPSFFHFMHGQFGKEIAWPGRPAISQEMSTGYPRNDDGHPVRFYLFKHYTPQTLVGPEAYENRDPAIFLKRQAFMTKELAELLRRTGRETCAGILHFAYVSWFKDVWKTDSIQPFTTYHSLQKALAPVLVSAELYGRHFFAGDVIRTRVCVANDASDGGALSASTLHWQLRDAGQPFAQGERSFPAVAYYANEWINVEIPIPGTLPAARTDAVLALSLQSGAKAVAKNEYQITLATRRWAADGAPAVTLHDPFNVAPSLLRESPKTTRLESLNAASSRKALVIAGADQVLAQPGAGPALVRFVAAGGRALLLHPAAQLPALFPLQVSAYRAVEGENVWMKIPESSVFQGIQPLDLCWFQSGNGAVPRACSGVYRVNRTRTDAIALAEVVDRHGYLKKPEDVVHISGSPLVELRSGRGLLIACEMMLEPSDRDPIAARLLTNILKRVAES
jgi:hypothetical protein